MEHKVITEVAIAGKNYHLLGQRNKQRRVELIQCRTFDEGPLGQCQLSAQERDLEGLEFRTLSGGHQPTDFDVSAEMWKSSKSIGKTANWIQPRLLEQSITLGGGPEAGKTLTATGSQQEQRGNSMSFFLILASQLPLAFHPQS